MSMNDIHRVHGLFTDGMNIIKTSINLDHFIHVSFNNLICIYTFVYKNNSDMTVIAGSYEPETSKI